MKQKLHRFCLLMAMVMLIALGIPAALSADTNIVRKESGLQSHPVYESTQIYKGALVCLNTSGYLVAAADTAGLRFAGVAYENVLGTTSGAKRCRVITEGVHKVVATSITQAMVGQKMYVSTDGVMDDTSTNFICCGTLVEYDSTTSGWIDIGDRALRIAEYLIDNAPIMFGTDGDASIKWNGTYLLISGAIWTSGNLTSAGALSVGGTSTLNGTVSCNGNLVTGGGIACNQGLTVGGILQSGNTTDASNSVSGSVILPGGMGIAKKLYVGTKIGVGNAGTTGGIITFHADNFTITHSSQKLTFSHAVWVEGALTGASTLSIGGTSTLNGTVTCNGNLATGGGIACNMGLTVGGILQSGNTTDATNSVTGSVILPGGMGIKLSLYVGNNIGIGDAGETGSIISFHAGNVTITHTTGLLTFSDAVWVNGALTGASTLSIGGTTVLNGTVSCNGNLVAGGSVTSGSMICNGNFNAGGTISGAGAIVANGNLSCGGTFTANTIIMWSNPPTSDPSNAGQLYIDSNAVKRSAG